MFAAGVWASREDAMQPPTGASLSFERIEYEIGPIPQGERRLIPVRVTNRDRRRPAHLLGAEDRCVPRGCLTWKGSVTAIPPGGSTAFDVEWKGTRPGHTTLKIPIYSDAPGQTEVVLTFTADVIPALAATPP